MRHTAASLIMALCFIAACGQGLPRSATVAPPTAPPSVEPSPTASPPTQTSPPATHLPTDTPQPTPEGLLRLTNDPSRDDTPAWSWDGQRIAFSSDRTGVYEIYTMSSDGSGLVQLTRDEDIQFKEDPAWSPDGRQIAFTALFDVYRVFAFDVRTAQGQPFSPSESTSEGFPKPLSDYYKDSFGAAWSPDGRRLALTMDDFYGDHQVFTLDFTTRDFFQVTHGPSPVYMPSWSPDGRWIAFASDAEGNLEIYLIRSDGVGLTRLTDHPADDGKPSWSPDGRFIVFSSDREGSTGLYTMRADGTEVTRLDTGPGEAFTPAWSPDGRYIAFVSNRDGNFEIYRIDAPALGP